MANKALWGWYPTGNVWVKLQVAATGKLVIDPTALFENPPTNGETEKAPQSDWAYDHWKDPYAHQDTGGKCGINVETLAAAKTLTPYVDTIRQYLATGGASRDVTLATVGAVAGDIFIIKNTDVYTNTTRLRIYQGITPLDYVYARGIKSFIFDGTNWVSADIASAETTDASRNVSLGFQAIAYNNAFAIGPDARAYDYGVCVGRSTRGYNRGVAIGDAAEGDNYGVAIGSGAKSGSLRYSIGLGHYASAFRVSETTVNITDYSSPRCTYTQGRWARDTADATPIEMYLAAYSTSRFTIRASSALAFRITVVARDDVANHVAMYTFEGVIKRDAANNTVMSICNKTVVFEDDATWDCNVTADDVNEALIITVTGDATNPVRWAAVLEGVESIFP